MSASQPRVGIDFEALVRRATTDNRHPAGHAPYAYQSRIADEGMPELLRVPTGAGKTMAAVLPWLWRRRFHPDAAVRAATPHWLVLVLPMRVLVEQTTREVEQWMSRLGLGDDVPVHTVMGGEGKVSGAWLLDPARDRVFVGTVDMLVSRALNRAYVSGRYTWPIDFGLFNSGCQWVFDELQLLGPALATSRQLQAFRTLLGTAAPCRTMWMSATAETGWLDTIDAPSRAIATVELDEADRRGTLATRLGAAKVVGELGVDPKKYARDLAAHAIGAHRAGTLTIVVCNTVKRARQVHAEVLRGASGEVVLLHSRFRPQDRRARVDLALADVAPGGAGRIVVTTQVLEAGVDVSATTMLTEAAPWPSVVQRAGRCNRDGEADGARLLWVVPPSPEPYLPADVDAAVKGLRDIEGIAVTAASIGERDVPVTEVVHAVLRRKDLLDLFDTTPDLAGNDIDVSRFIRVGDDLDAHVCWRAVESERFTGPKPTRDELCPVPVGELREWLDRGADERGRRAWRFDHVGGEWVRLHKPDVRPGVVVVIKSEEGGYSTELGWSSDVTAPVMPVGAEAPQPGADDEAPGDDHASTERRRWVLLSRHLSDVEAAVRSLVASLGPDGVDGTTLEAAAVAGRFHDIGKAHDVFQDTMARCAEGPTRDRVVAGGPWAKSPGKARHQRPHFRHELASMLQLLAADDPGVIPAGLDRDLVLYLVAAHHGRVRMGIRSLPGEAQDGTGRIALGVRDGDPLPAVQAPGVVVPAGVADLDVMELGGGASGVASWAQRSLALRDRQGLGPFRLAWLEALVRLADWRASADEDLGIDDLDGGVA